MKSALQRRNCSEDIQSRDRRGCKSSFTLGTLLTKHCPTRYTMFVSHTKYGKVAKQLQIPVYPKVGGT